MTVERTVDGTASAAREHEWLSFGEGTVAVHAPKGSYAARRAPTELPEAERIVSELEELLEIPEEHRGTPVDIYLIDAAPSLSGDGALDPHATLVGLSRDFLGPDALVRAVHPDGADAPLTVALTSLLVARWFGEAAAAAKLFHVGIGGVVAARTDTGPTLDEVRGMVVSEFEGGEFVSIFSPERDEFRPGPPDPLATSFVAFLVETFGGAALSHFLATYDPVRRDESAMSVYQRPLAALEEAWLSGLAKKSGTATALRRLFSYLLPLFRSNLLREL